MKELGRRTPARRRDESFQMCTTSSQTVLPDILTPHMSSLVTTTFTNPIHNPNADPVSVARGAVGAGAPLKIFWLNLGR